MIKRLNLKPFWQKKQLIKLFMDQKVCMEIFCQRKDQKMGAQSLKLN